MEKKWYQSPLTTKASVELENGFMEASVVDKDDPVTQNDAVDAGDQTISGYHDFTAENPWNE